MACTFVGIKLIPKSKHSQNWHTCHAQKQVMPFPLLSRDNMLGNGAYNTNGKDLHMW